MKFTFKIILTLLTAAVLLNASCKKSDPVTTTNKVDMNAISKQVAMDLYRSLSSGVNTSTNSGVKTGSTGTLKTMDSNNSCGETVSTTTNKAYMAGDTSRTIVGRSIFTYMCNGYFHNNYNIDAYLLKDTLTTTDQGAGYKNVYNVTLNYDVRSLDYLYTHVSIGGFTYTNAYISKVSNGVTTESHLLSTSYQWNDIIGVRGSTASGTEHTTFQSGSVDFGTHIVDKNATTDVNGSMASYSGYLQFLPDQPDTIRATFYGINGGGNKVYFVNLRTGEVTPQ